jgi:hypothetical protein
VATFTTSTLSVGSHSLTAVYGGSANFNGSVSPSVTQVVTSPPPVATKLTAAAATASVGGDGLAHLSTLSATLTVLSSGTPIAGRTITFSIGATVLGTAVTNASGVAQLSGAAVPPSTIIAAGNKYTVTFAGAAGFLASTATGSIVLV